MTIPKIIHQIWIGDSDIPDEYKKFSENIRDVHVPLGYQYYLWDNNLFELYEDDPVIKSYIKLTKTYAFIVDRFRLLLLRDYGGIYIDMDCKLIKSMDVILNRLSKDIIYFSGMREFQEVRGALIDVTVIGSDKNSRIIKLCIDAYEPDKLVGGKCTSDTVLKNIDVDVALLNYRYFYDSKITDDTVLLHETDDRLLSWMSDEQKGDRKIKLKKRELK